MKFKNMDLLHGPILTSILIFAVPMLISNIFQALYNTVDTMIVGNFLGDNSLAAIGATAAVYELLMGFSVGFGNGLSVVAGRAFGSGDQDVLKSSVAGSLLLGVGVTAVAMALAQFALYPLLELLQTPPDIIAEAYSYVYTVSICVGVTFLFNLCSGMLRAVGNSVVPLFFLIASSLLNIGLDILFIVPMHLGIYGAALATVIAQFISGVLCVIYIFKKETILIPSKQHFHVSPDLLKELAGQGLSMGLMMAIVSSGSVILQSSINALGIQLIAAQTTARRATSFFMMPSFALSMALSAFVSQNKGANQRERIKKGVTQTNQLMIGFSLLIAVLLFFIAKPLVSWISGSSDTIVIQNAANYVVVNSLFYAALAPLLNLRNALQGIGKKIIPLVSSIIEFIGKVLFAFLVIPHTGYWGVIFCEPIIWCCMLAQLLVAFYRDPYIKGQKVA